MLHGSPLKISARRRRTVSSGVRRRAMRRSDSEREKASRAEGAGLRQVIEPERAPYIEVLLRGELNSRTEKRHRIAAARGPRGAAATSTQIKVDPDPADQRE